MLLERNFRLAPMVLLKSTVALSRRLGEPLVDIRALRVVGSVTSLRDTIMSFSLRHAPRAQCVKCTRC